MATGLGAVDLDEFRQIQADGHRLERWFGAPDGDGLHPLCARRAGGLGQGNEGNPRLARVGHADLNSGDQLVRQHRAQSRILDPSGTPRARRNPRRKGGTRRRYRRPQRTRVRQGGGAAISEADRGCRQGASLPAAQECRATSSLHAGRHPLSLQSGSQPHDRHRHDRRGQDHPAQTACRRDAAAPGQRGNLRSHRCLRRSVLRSRNRHHPQPGRRALPDLVAVCGLHDASRIYRGEPRDRSERWRQRRPVLGRRGARAVCPDVPQVAEPWADHQSRARREPDARATKARSRAAQGNQRRALYRHRSRAPRRVSPLGVQRQRRSAGEPARDRSSVLDPRLDTRASQAGQHPVCHRPPRRHAALQNAPHPVARHRCEYHHDPAADIQTADLVPVRRAGRASPLAGDRERLADRARLRRRNGARAALVRPPPGGLRQGRRGEPHKPCAHQTYPGHRRPQDRRNLRRIHRPPRGPPDGRSLCLWLEQPARRIDTDAQKRDRPIGHSRRHHQSSGAPRVHQIPRWFSRRAHSPPMARLSRSGPRVRAAARTPATPCGDHGG